MNIPVFSIGEILVFLAAFAVAIIAWGWFRDQYEPAWTGRLPRFTRRWYGTRAHICLKSEAEGLEIPDLYEVIEWGDDSTPVPWLCVRFAPDPEAEASWRPVTDFSAAYVRRFHPVIALELLLKGYPGSPFLYDPLPLGHGAPPAEAAP
jgi:hypothetical protein